MIKILFQQIKGLAEVANKEEDDGGGGPNSTNGGGSNGDRGGGSEGVSSASSPTHKRAKTSPIENNCTNSRDAIRDLRIPSDHLRDLRNPPPSEPRDLSRDRDHSREIPPNHYSIVPGSRAYPTSQRAPSPPPSHHPSSTSHSNSSRSHLYPTALLTSRPSSKSPVPAISSGTPSYFPNSMVRSRSPHPPFDPAPGSSLLPPRTSPQSTANGPDQKMVGNIG